MKLKILAMACLVMTASGCAGTLLQPVEISNENRSRFQAADAVTVVMQESPGFLFNTPATALVNAGVATWEDPSKAQSWSGVMAAFDVPDFTDTVMQKFQRGLLSHTGSLELSLAAEREPYSTKLPTAYVHQYDSDYVLEIRTQFGSFSYGTFSWETYSMNYSGQARIIRTADEVVIWKATCMIGADENDVLKVPAEDFLSGDGEQLLAAAAYVTDECAEQLVASYAGAN